MKRIPTVIVLVLLFQLVLCSATPTISNITVTTDTNTAVVSYSVSPDSYCWVQYGVASGIYLWSSASFNSAPASPGICSVPINGLKDGTTYYFLPTARPDPDDETNTCNTPGCGAAEQSATTPAASVSHLPALPNSVQSNLLSEPDTTGYAVVPLAATGSGGECVSTANVTAPSGYSGSISIGDSLTTILGAPSKMWYGTVFEVPQGATCMVPRFSARGRGYELPPLPVDPLAADGLITAANHRWIVFRTTPGGPADFPPFNVRAGPSFFSHYGGFTSANPNTLDPSMDTGGTIFDATSAGQVHHIWIENLEFSVVPTPGNSYDVFFVWGRGAGGQSPPFPQYIVMRGNYFHGPTRSVLTSGTPSIQGVVFFTNQPNMQVALVGNYSDNLDYTIEDGYGVIPQALYFTDCGVPNMTCGWGGPVLIDNNYFQGTAMDIYVEQNEHADPNPYDFTITHNMLYWPYSSYPFAASRGSYGCRNQIELKAMNRGLVSGNYINGQWACANTGNAILTFNNVDLTVQSNYITNSAAGFGLNGTQNGATMISMNSSANRILVNNNVLFNLGRTLFHAGGGGVGATVFEMESSPSNVTITNNTVGPVGNDNGTYLGFFYPWILYNGGGGQIAGLTVQNNILPFGMGLTNYGGGIGVQNILAATGTLSHPATPLPTSTLSPVNFAHWLGSIAGYTDGQPRPRGRRRGTDGSGVQGVSVIAGGSGYPNSGSLSFTGCAGRPSGTYSAVGGVIQYATLTTFGFGCDPAAFTVSAVGGGSGASLRPAYGLFPSYNWSGNTIYCTTYQGKDMDQGTCGDLSKSMPAGDVWATGGTTALRMAAAGLVNSSLSDYRCVTGAQASCAAGANFDQLESDLGIVSHISATAAGTTASLSYLPPDARACSLDISADGGATWTRKPDSGGAGQRSVSLTGLLPNTTYQYRLLCYYDQTEAWFSFPSDSSNLATSGTLTTGSP